MGHRESEVAVVLRVLASGPSDTNVVRGVLDHAIGQWNASMSPLTGVVYVLLKWDEHGVSQLSDHPQQALNLQLVETCDAVMAIFNSRLGTPTSNYRSGTIEEIEYARAAQIPCSIVDVSAVTGDEQEGRLTEYLLESRVKNLLIVPKTQGELFAQVQRLLGYWAAQHLRSKIDAGSAMVRATLEWAYPPPSPKGINVETVRYIKLQNLGTQTATDIECTLMDANEQELLEVFVNPEPLECLATGSEAVLRLYPTGDIFDARKIRLRWRDDKGQHESSSSVRVV